MIGAIIACVTTGCQRTSTDKIDVSGRIEGYETNIGAKIGGRVDRITVREGNLVKRGQLLAQISDADIQAQLRGAKARVDRAREQVEQARDKIQEVRARIAEAGLRVCQMEEDSAGKIRQWQSTVASDQSRVAEAQANLAQARADMDLARIRKDRYEFLVARQAVTR
ncbi:MAG TPA: biotin/lipoyl-binding protein, partial [Candidatus Obscuribacterales bacterium]